MDFKSLSLLQCKGNVFGCLKVREEGNMFRGKDIFQGKLVRTFKIPIAAINIIQTGRMGKWRKLNKYAES